MLAMSNIAWSPDERLKAYALMADMKILGLEIAPGLFFHQSKNPFKPSPSEARRALSEMEAEGLSLISMQSLLFGVQGAALFEGADALERLERGMIQTIDLAQRFAIPNLVFGSPNQRRVPKGMFMDRATAHAKDVFRRLGDYAAEAGTVISIESNPPAYGTNFLNTLNEAAAFVVAVDHPNIALILDLGAMHMNGEFCDLLDYLLKVGGLLNHVHVSEAQLAPAPANLEEARLVFRALKSIGYTKAVSIEMKRTEHGLRDVKDRLGTLRQAMREERGP